MEAAIRNLLQVKQKLSFIQRNGEGEEQFPKQKTASDVPRYASHQCPPLILLSQWNNSSASQGRREFWKTLSFYKFVKTVYIKTCNVKEATRVHMLMFQPKEKHQAQHAAFYTTETIPRDPLTHSSLHGNNREISDCRV